MSMDSKQPPSSPQVRALGEHFETALDRAARTAEPPDYDQLAAYVDGTLDEVDREIIESWLEADPALRAEVDDMRALRDAMGQPAAAPAAPVAPAPPAARPATRSAGASGVLPFERPPARAVTTSRFRTTTVIVGAMAAAVIGTVTWMAVRTARVGDQPAGASGSQVARRPGQPGQPEQAPPVQSPGSGSTQVAANPPQRNAGGATTTVGSAAPAGTVAVRDAGGLISIDAAGAVTGLTAEAVTPQMAQLVADALTKGAVPSAAETAGLGGRELTLMGGSRQASTTRLAPLSPIATVVRTAQPVFRWSAHPGARNYVVTIYGPDFDRVMASPVVTDTSWTATSPLKPGVTYQWQVTADTPDGAVRAPAPPAPDARFRVINPAVAKNLDRDLARAGTSQLLKGLLLAQAGVLDEAEDAFAALHAANPDSKRVADLLARVRDRRLAR